MRTITARTALAVACAGTLFLAGCSGSDDDAAPKPTASPSASEEAPQTLLGEGSDIVNDVAARGDVTTASCEPADDEGATWKIVAQAKNSTDKPVTYDLAVRFAGKADGSVVGRDAVTTDVVEPGKSAPIEVETKLDAPSKDINCVFVSIARTAAD